MGSASSRETTYPVLSDRLGQHVVHSNDFDWPTGHRFIAYRDIIVSGQAALLQRRET